jgi:hypothetical protein
MLGSTTARATTASSTKLGPPHIPRRPTGITIFAVTGGDWNLIELPQEIVNLPLAEQMPALADLSRAYLEEYEGRCPFFGRVSGFRLVRWSDSIRFTAEDEFIEVVPGQFRRGQTTLTIGNKTVEISWSDTDFGSTN